MLCLRANVIKVLIQVSSVKQVPFDNSSQYSLIASDEPKPLSMFLCKGADKMNSNLTKKKMSLMLVTSQPKGHLL